jgi:hypothetical protein
MDEATRVPFTNLGVPANRKQVRILEGWMTHMLEHINIEDCANELEYAHKMATIYRFAFLEMVRHVTVHCVERGELLQEIWEKHLELATRYGPSVVLLR